MMINDFEKPKSQREIDWLEFSARVEKHLRDYTVPQYGDVGEDEITNYTVKDCTNQVGKYAKRYGSQSREGQQELDFIKMAHYAQCAWEKYVYGEPKEERTDEGWFLVPFDVDFDPTDYDYVGEANMGEFKYHIYKEKE